MPLREGEEKWEFWNMRAKKLGNIYGENRGTGFAGNVWDTDALSPTITTMGGGNREPLIIEEYEENSSLRDQQK